MNPFIENCAWDDVKHGWHFDCGPRAVLIQIADPATFFPVPKHKFEKVYQFEFLDAEDHDDRFPDEVKIQDDQAKEIVEILISALAEKRNVIVHCHAGICRSGAVVEVASILGFIPTQRYRQPNLRVKHRMMRCLGLTYDSKEKPYDVNGTYSDGGILIPFVGVKE